jgi:hypothetical protein
MSKELLTLAAAISTAAQQLQASCDEVMNRLSSADKTTTKSKTKPADDEMEDVKSPYKEEKKTKTKAKEEVVEPETEPEAADDDMFGDDPTEEDAGPTLDDVRKVVKDFATKHGKEKALKLLGKFKVTSIPDIKKADYAKVIELAKKHL